MKCLWFLIRCTALTTFAVLTTLMALHAELPYADDIRDGIFMTCLACFPIGLLIPFVYIWVANHAEREMTTAPITYPDWFTNPFDKSHPARTMHFMGWLIISSGIGLFVVSPSVGGIAISSGCISFTTGLSLLCGIKLCEIVFKGKRGRTR